MLHHSCTIITHLIDIEIVCVIASDPLHWSSTDVASWISWQVHHKNWPPVALHNFAMNGMELSLLTEEDFVQRAPLCGSSLFAQLDVWKLGKHRCPPSSQW